MRKTKLIIFILLLSFSVLTIAQGNETLDQIINNPDCTHTCFMRIEPGITTRQELISILRVSNSNYLVDAIEEESIYTWRLEEPVSGINARSLINARVENNLVTKVDIPLNFQDGEQVITSYGIPDTTTLIGASTFGLTYFDSGFTLLQDRGTGAISGIWLFSPDLVEVSTDNSPVIAHAGPDIILDDRNGYPVLALLDATQSIVNNGRISALSWNLNGEIISTEALAYIPLEYGEYFFILSLENDQGEIDFDSLRVNVMPSDDVIENGLLGEYYRNLNLQNLQFTRIDPMINFDWGLGEPRPDMSNLNFSIVWRGQLEAPITGTYTFSSNADDGISLWINGAKVFEQLIYESGGPAEVELKGGEKYDIRIEYFEAGGVASADLLWTIPQGSGEPELISSEYFTYDVVSDETPPLANAGPNQIIPIENEISIKVTLDGSASIGRSAEIATYQWFLENQILSEEVSTSVELKAGIHNFQLIVTDENGLSDRDILVIEVNNFSPLSGLHAEYFRGRNLADPILERIDRVVNFQWGYIAPDPTMDTSNYSVRWTGFIQPSETGIHRIYTYNDDGARMKIKDKQIIDDWNSHRPLYNSFDIYMKAGVLYPIELEYFQGAGNAVIQLLWLTPSSEEFTVIPQSNLFQPEYVAPEPTKPEGENG